MEQAISVNKKKTNLRSLMTAISVFLIINAVIFFSNGTNALRIMSFDYFYEALADSTSKEHGYVIYQLFAGIGNIIIGLSFFVIGIVSFCMLKDEKAYKKLIILAMIICSAMTGMVVGVALFFYFTDVFFYAHYFYMAAFILSILSFIFFVSSAILNKWESSAQKLIFGLASVLLILETLVLIVLTIWLTAYAIQSLVQEMKEYNYSNSIAIATYVRALIINIITFAIGLVLNALVLKLFLLKETEKTQQESKLNNYDTYYYSPASNKNQDLINQYQVLLNNGVITQEEFDKKKDQLSR